AKTDALHIFQRTANWVIPKEDESYTSEQLAHFRNDEQAIHESRQAIYEELNDFILFNNPDALREAEDAGIENMSVVSDPEVRKKLVPTHPFGCKRPLFSNLFYPIFNFPQVELVTDKVEKITETGVVTEDGKLREVDVVIVATGFHVTRYLSAIDVTGRNGVRLEDAWNDGAQAYLGIATHGFPNLFMLYGPNTNNGSILFMLERQVEYLVRQIKRIESEGLGWIDIRNEVETTYNDAMQRDIKTVAVWQANCGNYYSVKSGRMVTQWPHDLDEYTARIRSDDSTAYESAVK
ncbi:MAG: cyclohexanone monooxygenase, partial [Gammaproteobacteria bacterium]